MTEARLEELMLKSMSVDGSKSMSAAVRTYLPAKKVLEKAREYYLGQLKVGDIVCHKNKKYPQEITGFVTKPSGAPHVDLKDLYSGDITKDVWPKMYIAPFDEKDVSDIRYMDRNAALRARFESALQANDGRTVAALEAALK